MGLLHHGALRWTVTRQTNGTIAWSVAGSRDGSKDRVIAHGVAQSGAAATRAVEAVALTWIAGLGIPR